MICPTCSMGGFLKEGEPCPICHTIFQNINQPAPSPATDVDEVAKKLFSDGLLTIPLLSTTGAYRAFTLEDIQFALLTYGEKLRGENETQALLIKGFETTQAFLEKENEEYEALIVRKDAWINMVPHAPHCPLSHLSRFSTKGELRECGKQSALSPTISSSLVEDKERLDWLDYFHKTPEQFTIRFCEQFFKDKERLGIRLAIDAARNSSKSKL